MIRRAVERPVTTLLGAATLVVLGIFSLLRLPVSLLPALERPRLEIVAAAPDSAREEVLERVTRPLELRLAALSGVTSVRSTTGDGFARLQVESDWQTDDDRLRIETERRLAGLEVPGVSLSIELATGDPEPIVEVAVFGGSGAARTAFTRGVLVPELARLEGAGKIEMLGLSPLHPVVRPRAAALAARGLTAVDLVDRLRPLGASMTAGRARAGALVRPLLVREDAGSLDVLRALRLRGQGVLGDVADVALEEVRDETAFRLDGREGTLVRIFRAPEANAVALAARARAQTGELNRRSVSGLRIEVVADRSAEVEAALKELGVAALAGLVLGIAVLRFMLGRWRPTLALAVAVPASVLATFSAFFLFDVPLDVISLAGLALAAGMLVDSSIVVLEAIETARARAESEPALAGVRQIAMPVVAGFLATAVVFLPLIYLKGLARAFFGAQAFAIVASLAASLLFSLTVTPVLARGRGAASSAGRNPGRALYLRLLDRTLARPAGAVLAGVAALVLALAAAALLPHELMPDAGTRDVVVRYRLPADLTPEAARRQGETVEVRTLAALAVPPVSRRSVQLPETTGFINGGEESGWIELRFADAASADRERRRLRAALARLPGLEVRVEPRPSAFLAAVARAGRRLEVVASAATPARAEELARRVEDRLRQTVGLHRSAVSRPRARQALLLSWNMARLDVAGGDRSRLETQVREGLGDRNSGRVRIAGVEPEILVRPMQPEDPALIPVSATGSGVVPLAALARLDAAARPPAFEREDGRPAVRLIFDEDWGLSGPALDRSLRSLARAADEEVAPGGQVLELRRAFGQLGLALGLSLVLVFLTVAALYESLSTPLVVMTPVPVALGGALCLLAASGQTLNVMSFLGLILLAGIVVNNAIVLVHRIEDHRRNGSVIDAAIRLAGEERYRPILMTTLTTLAGMLPLALLGGEGAELRRALALAVIGGMATAFFASLLLVPVLYRFSHRPRRA